MDFRIFVFDSSAAVCKYSQRSLVCSQGYNQWVNICKRLGAMPYCFAFSIIPKKIFIRRSTESGIPSLSQRRATHSQSVSAITGKIVSILSPSKGNRVNKSRSFTKWNGCNAGSGTWTVHTDWCICHFLYKVDHPFQRFLLLQPLLLRHIRPEMWLPLLSAFWLFL